MRKKINKIDLKLSFIRSAVNRDLGDIKELIDLSEGMLRRQCTQLTKQLDRECQKATEEEKEFLGGWYAGDFIQLTEVFPKIQRYSLFTTVMASAEFDLYRICIEMQQILKKEKEYKKPRKSIIKNCFRYLEEECHVSLSKFRIYTDEIEMYQRLRNCIVHSEGKNTDQNPTEIEKYCKEKPTLSIDRHGYIILKENFLNIAMHIITQFFQRLIESCKTEVYRDSYRLTHPPLAG
ncbi:MAG: hypothetical protein C0621_04880 [Desulfuromonas sp.]|nr:MAG: hypothetical protein C0621_04880 [Desulfuromonas sp.]